MANATTTIRPRAVRAPDFIYHANTPAHARNLWCVAGTAYGFLHSRDGGIRTWKSRSGARHAAARYVPL